MLKVVQDTHGSSLISDSAMDLELQFLVVERINLNSAK